MDPELGQATCPWCGQEDLDIRRTNSKKAGEAAGKNLTMFCPSCKSRAFISPAGWKAADAAGKIYLPPEA